MPFVPEYLRPYVVQQNPSLYTAIDHASWRFIMKISRAFFSKHAHPMYLRGLEETGISTDRIPLISEMDEKLQRFGWHAVAVSGFIPPAVFMEFLSRGILPIACDMRKLENLSYTPAPDIVHEAAGHAPIIADPDYARYLRHYGELAEKAIYSSQDLDVYEAVRNLSDTKEDPESTSKQVAEAQKRLDRASAAVDHVSEATQLGRMGWWTIEYGLLGNPSDPKIYGAGLLSSVAESYHCLEKNVKKIAFAVDCVDTSYDITKPQPQLFIAPDFTALVEGLDRLAERMAYRRGGLESLEKARKAAVTATAVLDTGIQISGALARIRTDRGGKPIYLHYQGPSQLSYESEELPGQGAKYHRDGFGTALGKFKQNGRKLEFESGIVVEGDQVSTIERGGKILVRSFEKCAVRHGAELLFDPAWGTYDLACGETIVSVFGGPADRSKYLAATGGFKQPPGTPKTNLTDANRALNELYARTRKIRDTKSDLAELGSIHAELDKKYPGDWLLRYELLELDPNASWALNALERLHEIAKTSPDRRELISRGLEVL